MMIETKETLLDWKQWDYELYSDNALFKVISSTFTILAAKFVPNHHYIMMSITQGWIHIGHRGYSRTQAKMQIHALIFETTPLPA
jgi:hypothetical protein